MTIDLPFQEPINLGKCPHCQALTALRWTSIYPESGWELWSDQVLFNAKQPFGRGYAWLVVCCWKCAKFYGIWQCERINQHPSGQPTPRLLSAFDCHTILTSQTLMQNLAIGYDPKQFGSRQLEKALRFKLWELYNDYYRNGKADEINPLLRKIASENAMALFNQIHYKYDEYELYRAELLGMTGNFSGCRKELSVLDLDDLRDRRGGAEVLLAKGISRRSWLRNTKPFKIADVDDNGFLPDRPNLLKKIRNRIRYWIQ